MKLFRCDHCSNVIYFENTVCEQCGHALGYWPQTNMMVSLDPAEGQSFTAPVLGDGRFVYCANAAHGACNWLIAADPAGEAYCRACRHNGIVPPMDTPANLAQWATIERAKKRLFYSLLRFALPLATRTEDPVHGLRFEFLADDAATAPVMTGHDDGIITLALKEADDAVREARRLEMGEPYRTLLGHFRHEIGHYYWDILVANGPARDEFRTLFGDERADYAEALRRHYADGVPPDWQQRYISSYATAHPWEDWAETFAHLLHVVDTTEMAAAFGVRLAPRVDVVGELRTRIDFDPYVAADLDEVIGHWVPLASLINNLNRAVGQRDAYPFVLTPAVQEKLAFVHKVLRAAGSVAWTVNGPNGPVSINTPRNTP